MSWILLIGSKSSSTPLEEKEDYSCFVLNAGLAMVAGLNQLALIAFSSPQQTHSNSVKERSGRGDWHLKFIHP